MGLLQELGTGQGFLKAGFQGFQGSGKTYTATLLAIGTRELFKLPGPIAFVDTENATEYIAPLVRDLTGLQLVGRRTRDFAELLAIGQECSKAGVSVLVVDSMTHFWRKLCDAYLDGINQARAKKGWNQKKALEFQDWAPIKEEWAKWTDFFLNSPLHVIICGRAGYEYEFQQSEGRKELVKTGTKMKTEAEFGFEPSLLVEMEIKQHPHKTEAGKFVQVRSAQVLKDRFAEIDGEELVFQKAETKKAELAAVMKAFGPHVRRLIPGAHSTVSTSATPLQVDEDGDGDWNREKRLREIFLEEIKGALIAGGLDGNSAEAKGQRMALLAQVFGTRSWSAIESFASDRLRECLARLKQAIGLKENLVTDPPPAEDDIDFGKPAAKAGTPPANGSSVAGQPASPPVERQSKSTETTAVPPAGESQPQSSLPLSSGLSVELQQQVADVIGADTHKALAWMRTAHGGRKAWLGPNDGLEALTERHAQAIIASGGKTFRRTVGLPV